MLDRLKDLYAKSFEDKYRSPMTVWSFLMDNAFVKLNDVRGLSHRNSPVCVNEVNDTFAFWHDYKIVTIISATGINFNADPITYLIRYESNLRPWKKERVIVQVVPGERKTYVAGKVTYLCTGKHKGHYVIKGFAHSPIAVRACPLCGDTCFRPEWWNAH